MAALKKAQVVEMINTMVGHVVVKDNKKYLKVDLLAMLDRLTKDETYLRSLRGEDTKPEEECPLEGDGEVGDGVCPVEGNIAIVDTDSEVSVPAPIMGTYSPDVRTRALKALGIEKYPYWLKMPSMFYRDICNAIGRTIKGKGGVSSVTPLTKLRNPGKGVAVLAVIRNTNKDTPEYCAMQYLVQLTDLGWAITGARQIKN